MIRRLNCPGCNRVLRLDDSSNVAAGQCPACGKKFRMPWAAPAAASTPRPQSAAKPANSKPRSVATPPAVGKASPAAAEASQPVEPPPAAKRRKPFEDEEDNGAAYQFHAADAPGPGQLLEAEVVDDYEEEEEYEEERPRRRKKKKKKRSRSGPGMSLEMSNFLITMGVLGFLWMGLTLLVFLAPDTTLFVLLIGFAVGSIGQSWFMRIVWDDGIQVALMCMFIPFYSWLYLLGNLERAGKPFAVRFFGGLIVASAIIAFIVRGAFFGFGDDEPDEDYYPREPVPGMHEFDEDPDMEEDAPPRRRPQSPDRMKQPGRPQGR